MTPTTHPGLLGICLSGAGPTILALVSNESSSSSPSAGTISTDDSEITFGQGERTATPQMSRIGEAIKQLWQEEGIEVEWLALSVDEEGATLREL
jgi:homoserine kinase